MLPESSLTILLMMRVVQVLSSKQRTVKVVKKEVRKEERRKARKEKRRRARRRKRKRKEKRRVGRIRGLVVAKTTTGLRWCRLCLYQVLKRLQ